MDRGLKIKPYHLDKVIQEHHKLVSKINEPYETSNGVYLRYKNPIITENHIPIHWRYDLNPDTNPNGLERIGFNATLNSGAIKWNGKYVLCVRVEGNDRKSFFALAESDNGIDNFKFWDKPCVIPLPNGIEETNVYDMRLTKHEDGWVYGIFCSESKDPNVPASDTSSAIANAGIVRTKDLINWERLPNLNAGNSQQRNVVIHPEFVDGKYAIYTRPQQGFITVGSGGGIGLGFIKNMENPIVEDEKIINNKIYHTVYELKNGLGPSPIKTSRGWLHLAHGVRNTAAGLRYTLYMFMTDLNDISKVIHQPAGHFMAPKDDERVGDVSNVLFANGWIQEDDGTVYIYYASSDTRMHVATSTIDKLVDYCINTPEDKYTSSGSVATIIDLIDKNKSFY